MASRRPVVRGPAARHMLTCTRDTGHDTRHRELCCSLLGRSLDLETGAGRPRSAVPRPAPGPPTAQGEGRTRPATRRRISRSELKL